MSPRALRDGELFEIVIQKMVDRWSGSIEAGEKGQKGTRRGGDGGGPPHPSPSPVPTSVSPVTPVVPAGVTAIRPEDLEFPNTMTDIDYDTWMLR